MLLWGVEDSKPKEKALPTLSITPGSGGRLAGVQRGHCCTPDLQEAVQGPHRAAVLLIPHSHPHQWRGFANLGEGKFLGTKSLSALERNQGDLSSPQMTHQRESRKPWLHLLQKEVGICKANLFERSAIAF